MRSKNDGVVNESYYSGMYDTLKNILKQRLQLAIQETANLWSWDIIVIPA